MYRPYTWIIRFQASRPYRLVKTSTNLLDLLKLRNLNAILQDKVLEGQKFIVDTWCSCLSWLEEWFFAEIFCGKKYSFQRTIAMYFGESSRWLSDGISHYLAKISFRFSFLFHKIRIHERNTLNTHIHNYDRDRDTELRHRHREPHKQKVSPKKDTKFPNEKEMDNKGYITKYDL